jgi:hypothetical protein
MDAHVHIHDCFDISDFLDCAYANFRDQMAVRYAAVGFKGVLLLTESHGVNGFGALCQAADGAGEYAYRNWKIARSAEAESVIAISRTGQSLTIIAGRQIVTAERLEILALGLAEQVRDGLPIDNVIAYVQEKEALCVLPWGFGKWTGRRGRIVREILGGDTGENFFIGDNAGRLARWPEPAEFATARARQIRILPGSDPLPYAREAGAVGRFGFIIDGDLDMARPFTDIRRRLLDSGTAIEPYGNLEQLLPFIRNQVAMQLRKFA